MAGGNHPQPQEISVWSKEHRFCRLLNHRQQRTTSTKVLGINQIIPKAQIHCGHTILVWVGKSGITLQQTHWDHGTLQTYPQSEDTV